MRDGAGGLVYKLVNVFSMLLLSVVALKMVAFPFDKARHIALGIRLTKWLFECDGEDVGRVVHICEA